MASLKQEWLYYARVVKELLFPRKCAVCHNTIDHGYVCEVCRKHYLLAKTIQCEPREEYLAGQSEAKPEDVLNSIFLLYKYDGVFEEALHEAKFAKNAAVLPFLREEAEAALPSAKMRWLGQFDLATCIPTSPERYKKRGYDLPQEIFAPLLNERDTCIYSDNILQRVRTTAPLFALDAQDRRAELQGCFAVLPQFNLQGKRILLCDDIFTTGSTLAEAALVLRKAGAKEVHALTLTAARANWE